MEAPPSGHVPLPAYIFTAGIKTSTASAIKQFSPNSPAPLQLHRWPTLHAGNPGKNSSSRRGNLRTNSPRRPRHLPAGPRRNARKPRDALGVLRDSRANRPPHSAEREPHGRPIFAIGTTVVRALEAAALRAADSGSPELLLSGKADARLFIYPGFHFRVVDALLTNFHLPRSTLLALVCAFAGRENVLAAYNHAVQAGYRFYSYGDCMLIR